MGARETHEARRNPVVDCRAWRCYERMRDKLINRDIIQPLLREPTRSWMENQTSDERMHQLSRNPFHGLESAWVKK
ncbi:hypothetical protein PIIN_07030 [Serendipita indica DSM 11827]|uniref:Uncharacterized protein n=1 Tax=Serendipita indica (strain DSM 11827) TaxID=1109443 RepID=G4TP28_SERID|nr:hypothetical protein PIIN_07030 [Serendipita indica DSM 11827]